MGLDYYFFLDDLVVPSSFDRTHLLLEGNRTIGQVLDGNKINEGMEMEAFDF